MRQLLDWVFHHEFEDKFECALDINGIIWIKYPDEKEFDRPCMKCCYEVIKTRSIPVAKYILSKSCEIQNDDIITKRASGYRSL